MMYGADTPHPHANAVAHGGQEEKLNMDGKHKTLMESTVCRCTRRHALNCVPHSSTNTSPRHHSSTHSPLHRNHRTLHIRRECYVIPAFSGIPNKGDKIRSGYLTRAFLGAQKRAELQTTLLGFGCNTPFHFFFRVRERPALALALGHDDSWCVSQCALKRNSATQHI